MTLLGLTIHALLRLGRLKKHKMNVLIVPKQKGIRRKVYFCSCQEKEWGRDF